MYSRRRALWLYPLFQIPLMLFALCLLAAALCWLLGLGRPNVAAAIALDLSSSTYENQPFNAPNTIVNQELEAVRSYLTENAKLNRPNQVQVFGFGALVVPLTPSFQSDSAQVQTALAQTLADPNLSQRVLPGSTNVDAALQSAQTALSALPAGCKEILLVTDGTGDRIADTTLQTAKASKTRINVLLVTSDLGQSLKNIDLAGAALQTGGVILPGQVGRLTTLFIDQFFTRFNSNLKWIFFWLGLAWVALMWLLILPLDRWILQYWLKLPMNTSGQITLGNALFWTVLTPIIVWQVFGIPLISPCS
ncbi:MAG: VWA domain-containing protein [Leptolyngbyaceae cyanobacterium CRU_2_3]|nr:VWA domain-containing protein [Leptolyngbyaceae cyanobacterium CRU_2_3]